MGKVKRSSLQEEIQLARLENAATKLTCFCKTYVYQKRFSVYKSSLKTFVLKEQVSCTIFLQKMSRATLFITFLFSSTFKQEIIQRNSKQDDAATQIQRVFRSFSTRLFLKNASLSFQRQSFRQWNDEERDIASCKVESDFLNQQIYIRHVCIEKYRQSVVLFQKCLQKVNIDTTNNMLSEDKDGKTQDLMEHMENQINFTNKIKGKNDLIVRQVGTFFEQLQARSESIQSVLHFISLHPHPDGDDSQYYAKWTQSETEYLTTSLISCDIVQETVIEREMNRVSNDLNKLLRSNEMTRGIVDLIRKIRCLEDESCGLNGDCFPNLQVYENALTMIQTKLKIAREKELSRACHNISKIMKNEVRICDMHFVEDVAKTSSFLIDKQPYPKVQKFETEEWMAMFNHRPWLIQRDTDEFNFKILRDAKSDKLNKRSRELQRTNKKLEYDRSQALIAKNKIQMYMEKSQVANRSIQERNAYQSAAKALQAVHGEFEKSKQSQCEFINTETLQINEAMRSLREDEAKTRRKIKIQPSIAPKHKDITSYYQKINSDIGYERWNQHKSALEIQTKNSKASHLKDEHFRREERTRATQQYVHDRVQYHYLSSQDLQEGLRHVEDAFDWTSDQKVLNSAGITDKNKLVIMFLEMINTLRRKTSHLNMNFNLSLPNYKGLRVLRKRNDPELRMMVATANKAMTNQSKLVSAITSLKFTVGKTETDAFAESNDSNYSEGRSYYQSRLELGQHDQIVLWVQKDTNQDKFLSGVQIGSGRPSEREFQLYSGKGFHVENHKELDAGIWFTRSLKSSTVVSNIKVSYCNSGNENIYEKDYEKIETCLSQYGLANAYLWVEKKGRDELNTTVDIASMEKELEEYESMLSNAPSDYILRGMVSELTIRIELAKGQEIKRRELTNVDHLEYIIDFLALSERDVTCFRTFYRKMDSEKEGRVSIDRLVRFLGESATLSPIVNSLIEIGLGGGHIENGKINFSETTRALATIATFSNEEIVKAIFRTFDKSGCGVISNSDFYKLLAWLHPSNHNRGATLRALREIDLPDQITYNVFRDLNERFPFLLFPILKFQENVRRNCISAKFWRKKRKKFQHAKELAMQRFSHR